MFVLLGMLVLLALLFTFAVLMYSLKGGLRSSIFTDVLHGANLLIESHVVGEDVQVIACRGASGEYQLGSA